MARKQVMIFFSALLLVAGALVLLRLFSPSGVTGASISHVPTVEISELSAIHDGNFLLVSFVVASEHPEVQIVYALDAGGESVRSGDFVAILEPGKPERHVFRIRQPEQSEGALFITVSADDGASLAYHRTAVTEGSSSSGTVSRSFFPAAGLAAVLVFVLVYLMHAENRKRHVHAFARHATQNLAFHRERALPRRSAAFK